jgi:hexose-6-phosphate dehydrogenase
VYLSVSPDFYPQISEYVNKHVRPKSEGAWLRVIVEKPFGRDSATAKALASSLNAQLATEEMYLIDHYLGKAMVRGIDKFRAANPEIEALWNSEHVARIEVAMKETETAEGRTSFYNNYGVVRDVLQNHLSVMATNTLGDLGGASGDAADRLSATAELLAPIGVQGGGSSYGEHDQFGQYEGYQEHVRTDSDGKTANSFVATSASVVLASKSPRWAGVPVVMIAGKGLNERTAYVRVSFKPHHKGGHRSNLPCNVHFNVQGGVMGTSISMCSNLPFTAAPAGWVEDEDPMWRVAGVRHFKLAEAQANPYNVLVRAALDGDQSSFCTVPEIMQLWRLWSPLVTDMDKKEAAAVDELGGKTPAHLTRHPIGDNTWSSRVTSEHVKNPTLPVETEAGKGEL